MITTNAVLHSIEKSPSSDIAFLVFQVSETFCFAEGQFMMIECQTDSWLKKKPYSIATTNSTMQEKNLIGFYIKQASDDGVSHYLTQRIQIKDEVSMKWPVWHYIDRKLNNNYLLISTWSWLSPNLWILEKLLNDTSSTTIVSLFGERAREKMIDSSTQLLCTHDSRLTSLITYSKEWPVADRERSGYVQDHLNECLQIFGQTKAIQVFLCWRPEMVKEVEQKLLTYWISKDMITTEKY